MSATSTGQHYTFQRNIPQEDDYDLVVAAGGRGGSGAAISAARLGGPPPAVSKVNVVFKTHLDLGFTDFARNVIRRYLEGFIPEALRLAAETRELPERLVWLMGSWLVYQFLEKASPSQRHRVEEAIHRGDIHWHALPFTTHTELMDAGLFHAGSTTTRGEPTFPCGIPSLRCSGFSYAGTNSPLTELARPYEPQLRLDAVIELMR